MVWDPERGNGNGEWEGEGVEAWAGPGRCTTWLRLR